MVDGRTGDFGPLAVFHVAKVWLLADGHVLTLLRSMVEAFVSETQLSQKVAQFATVQV